MSEPPTLLLGDCFEVLQTLEFESVDACVTDPPYGLGFMGKHWDKGVPDADVWREVYRVLKPGAHLLSFFGTRTYHRGAVAIEDAGFEIRDQIGWLYGSGFPKSLDVSKSIDKAAGAERTEVIGTRHRNVKPFDDENGWNKNNMTGAYEYKVPATDAAKQWNGWGTALKPAHETMVHAVKPLTIPWLCEKLALTICRSQSLAPLAERISKSSPSDDSPPDFALWRAALRSSTPADFSDQTVTTPFELVSGSIWNTAWLWLSTLAEASKLGSMSTIATEIGLITDLKTLSCLVSESTLDAITKGGTRSGGGASNALAADAIFKSVSAKLEAIPTIFADAPAIVKDADNGLRRESIVVARKPLDGTVAANVLRHGVGGLNIDGCRVGQTTQAGRWPANVIHDGSDEVLMAFTPFENGDSPSRFFYTAKASKDDRNDGLEEYDHTEAADMVDREPDSAGMNSPRTGAGRTSGAKNHHPTVKPTSLMRYLVRLVCPKGGLVLDPFAGSGTTLIAAYREDCRGIGIELDTEYHKMASHRIDKATAQLRLAL